MAALATLSVVLTISSDTISRRAHVSHLEGCLQALAQQRNAPPLEVIVPHHPEVDGIEELSARFPEVIFLSVPSASIAGRKGGGREHHDVLRSHGLKIATGEIITLLEDYARPAPDWASNIVAAHRGPWAAVGGAIVNGIHRPLNWAVYFCDFGKYQNPLPPGPTTVASDINTSYKRSALEAVRPLWDEAFREIVVNGALIERGEELVLDPDIVVHHHRSGLELIEALKERFIWGRSYALTRTAVIGDATRYLYAALSPALPVILLARMARTARTRGRHFADFVRAVPHLVPLLISWSMGEMLGYLAPRPARVRAPARREGRRLFGFLTALASSAAAFGESATPFYFSP